MNLERKQSAIAIAIFLLATVYYAWLILSFFPHIQLAKYIDAARLYSQGKLSGERLLDFSPFYFYLHSFIPHATVIYWLHILAAAIACALFYLLLLRFFRLPVALIGTFLFLTDRSISSYAQVFEPEIFLIVFMIAFVYFFYRDTLQSIFLSGIFFALGTLCRPVFLPLLILIPWILRLRSKQNWHKASALFLLPVVICIAGVWIRNFSAIGHFSPYVMNPGTVFYEGNNPNSHGQSSIYPTLVNEVAKEFPNTPDAQHEMYRLIARRIANRNLSVAQINQYWSSKALAYMVEHPGRWLYLLRLKTFHVFHEYLWHDLANAHDNEKRLAAAHLPAVPFGWISAMALLGMILVRDRWKDLLVFYLLFFCQFLVLLFFYISARQHATTAFLFLFFACTTIQFFLDSQRRQGFLVAVLVLTIGFLFYYKTDLMREEDHLWSATEQSNQFLQQAYQARESGELQRAAQLMASSVGAAPWYLETRRLSNVPFPNGFLASSLNATNERTLSAKFDKAYLLLEIGELPEASYSLNELIGDNFQLKRDFLQSSELYYYLGRIAEKDNRVKAISILKSALDRSPGDPWILANLAVLTGDNEYERQLFLYFDDIDAHYYLGRAALLLNERPQAVGSFSYVTSKLPEYRDGWMYLAVALEEAGRFEDGARAYRKAISIRPDPVMFEKQILPLFLKYTEKKPKDAFARFSYGIVLRQFGHFQEALDMQKSALALNPDNVQIESEIVSLAKVLKK